MYKIGDKGHTSVCAIGNGKVCAYSYGVDIFQIFGNHYSAPNMCSFKYVGDDAYAVSNRIPETAVWEHTIYKNGNVSAKLTDFAAAGHNMFIRSSEGEKNSWTIELAKVEAFKPLKTRLTGFEKAFWCEIPAGSTFYGSKGFVIGQTIFAVVVMLGDADAVLEDSKKINVTMGNGSVAFIFGNGYKQIDKELDALRNNDISRFLSETIEDGRAFTARRRKNCPLPDEQDKIVDGVATLIRCQQSYSGGVLAGHKYHLAYLRDNFGVLLGLLKMGCYEESKKLLLYYNDIYTKYGELHCAQGTDAFAFHIHENDESEITAYAILMACEYYKHTNDEETFKRTVPMIKWAVGEQHSVLVEGMLPFNGDETYIAGNLLCRCKIYEGSMEATALYHLVCDHLINYKELLALDDEFIELVRGDKAEIEKYFAENFIKDGRIYANCPRYLKIAKPRPFTSGAFLCGHGLNAFGALSPHGYAVCLDCADIEIPEHIAGRGEIHFVPAAFLMPVVLGCSLLQTPEVKAEIENMRNNFLDHGTLLEDTNGKTVGYEYGEILMAVDKDDPAVPVIIEKMLGVIDDTGAWVEYYVNEKPTGCMSRPWESGLNVAAFIEKI